VRSTCGSQVIRQASRRHVLHGIVAGLDVGRRCPAAAADNVEQAVAGKVDQLGGEAGWRLVVAAHGIGQPGVGVADKEPGVATSSAEATET